MHPKKAGGFGIIAFSMNIIEELLKNVRKTQKQMPSLVSRSINQEPGGFEDAQREQMLRSERSDGGAITPKYSKAYARLKGKSTPDLKLTGAFQEAIFAKSTSKTFVLSSKDKKKPFLVNRYSDNIFGLNSNGVADVEKDAPFRSALIDNIINSILP